MADEKTRPPSEPVKPAPKKAEAEPVKKPAKKAKPVARSGGYVDYDDGAGWVLDES